MEMWVLIPHLKLYERLYKEKPKADPRFRIEHCTMINDDLVKRMKTLGVIPTPFSTYVYYHGEKMKALWRRTFETYVCIEKFFRCRHSPHSGI